MPRPTRPAFSRTSGAPPRDTPRPRKSTPACPAPPPEMSGPRLGLPEADPRPGHTNMNIVVVLSATLIPMQQREFFDEWSEEKSERSKVDLWILAGKKLVHLSEYFSFKNHIVATLSTLTKLHVNKEACQFLTTHNVCHKLWSRFKTVKLNSGHAISHLNHTSSKELIHFLLLITLTSLISVQVLILCRYKQFPK